MMRQVLHRRHLEETRGMQPQRGCPATHLWRGSAGSWLKLQRHNYSMIKRMAAAIQGLPRMTAWALQRHLPCCRQCPGQGQGGLLSRSLAPEQSLQAKLTQQVCLRQGQLRPQLLWKLPCRRCCAMGASWNRCGGKRGLRSKACRPASRQSEGELTAHALRGLWTGQGKLQPLASAKY